MFRVIRYVAALAVLAAAVQVPAHIQAAQGSQAGAAANNLYIVQLAEFPVSSYTGGQPGFAATKPERGQKFDPNTGCAGRAGAGVGNRRPDQLHREVRL